MAKQKGLKKKIGEIERLERKQLKELKIVEKEERNIEIELKKFEGEIEKLRDEIKPGAIEKFTIKDISRGIVGGMFGMSRMAWHEGVRTAAVGMSIFNLAAVIVLTIIAGSSVLYFSQYRKIKEKWVIKQLLPRRFVFLYALSMVIVTGIYVLFNIIQIGVTPVEDIVKLVLVISLPAMIGASTADIIK